MLAIKGIYGSLNLLDLQGGFIINDRTETKLAKFFYKENINIFGIFYNGLKIKPLLKPTTGIPGHQRNMWNRQTVNMARQIST